MGLGHWPERKCPKCGAMVPTVRNAMPDDDFMKAWDPKTEEIFNYETGPLILVHHGPGDRQRFGRACSGSFAEVGPPLTRPARKEAPT